MANSKPESRLIKAAGAVAWRPGPDGRPEILLVHRRKYDDWSLPKGKVEPGEALPVTAVREVLEEGGARLALGRRLDSVRYNVGGRPKRVHYWSASVTSVDDHAVPNDEVDKVEWVAADRAAERISYNRDNAVVADFARLPAQTVPVILLRHAKAVAKSHWKRADDRRPLDDAGRADAKALAELLACFGPRARLITSPAARCVETLRPFAELSGVELREEPSLSIHHHSSRTVPPDSHPSITALLSRGHHRGRAHDHLRAPGEHPPPAGRRPGRPRRRPAPLRRRPRQRPPHRWPAAPKPPGHPDPAGTHPRPPQGMGRRPPHLRLLGPQPNPPPAHPRPPPAPAPAARILAPPHPPPQPHRTAPPGVAGPPRPPRAPPLTRTARPPAPRYPSAPTRPPAHPHSSPLRSCPAPAPPPRRKPPPHRPSPALSPPTATT